MTTIFEQFDAAREMLGYDTDFDDDDSEHEDEDEDVGGIKIDQTDHDQSHEHDRSIGGTLFPWTCVNVNKSESKKISCVKMDRDVYGVSTLARKDQSMRDLPSKKDQATDIAMLGQSATLRDGDSNRIPNQIGYPSRKSDLGNSCVRLEEESAKVWPGVCIVRQGSRLSKSTNGFNRAIINLGNRKKLERGYLYAKAAAKI